MSKTKIEVTPEFGRGIYANQNIFKNEVIARCELLVLYPYDMSLINKTPLARYTFKYNNEQDCLVLGDGMLFNHSNEPNVRYRLIEYDGRMIMEFSAIDQMEVNEQLLIDYGADVEVDIGSYIDQKSLMGGKDE